MKCPIMTFNARVIYNEYHKMIINATIKVRHFLENMRRFVNHQVVLIYSKLSNILNFVHIFFVDGTSSYH